MLEAMVLLLLDKDEEMSLGFDTNGMLLPVKLPLEIETELGGF
jgi:hypothetical protein